MDGLRIRATVLFFLGLMLAGCGSSPFGDSSGQASPPGREENVEKVFEQALEAYRKNDFERTLKLLRPFSDRDQLPARVPMLHGAVHYELNHFKQAHRYWVKTSRIRTETAGRQLLRHRINRSRKLADLNLVKHRYSHFVLLAHPRVPSRLVERTHHRLQQVYDDLGGELSYFPQTVFTVIIHSPKSFREVMKAPHWSGGLFDGKIHLPYRGGEKEFPNTSLLYHEYTHALVFDLATGSCPMWFNEGLATFEQFRMTGSDYTYRLLPRYPPERNTDSLKDLSRLFRSASSTRSARVAYEYGHSVVAYMRERYGMIQIRRLLQETGRTQSFQTALSRVLSTDRSDLYRNWIRWVQRRQ